VIKLGEGQIRKLSTGESIFVMDSYNGNPVVLPQQLGLTWSEDGQKRFGAVFNCGATVHDEKVFLLPRCHSNYFHSSFFDPRTGRERPCLENYVSEIWVLVSEDGIHFKRFHDVVIKGDGTDHKDFEFGIEDIRIIRRDDLYVLIGCGKVGESFKTMNADRIAIYTTTDFKAIEYRGMVKDLDLRNAVLFPEPVDGDELILLRHHPNIHLDRLDDGLDQILDPTAHQEAWQLTLSRKDETLLIEVGQYMHEREKIGPGPQLIKTEKGWLMIYHSVGEVCSELRELYGIETPVTRGYTVCAALLDLENPRKILRRTKYPLYVPCHPWELFGNDKYGVDVPTVVFPVGAFVQGGKLLVYAGAADKYVILLSCNLKNLVDYLWEHGVTQVQE